MAAHFCALWQGEALPMPYMGEGEASAEVMSMTKRVLVIEDAPDIAHLVQTILTGDGFQVTTASTGTLGLAQVRGGNVDLIVLDLGLPDMDGRDVCRQIRAGSRIPIVMLTGRASEMDKVVGLELGADDYITKPFGKHEFLARVRAVLRRVQSFGDEQSPERLAAGAVEVSMSEHRVWVAGREVSLTHTEFDLLVYLIQHAGRAVTREVLLDKVWGIKAAIDTRTVDNHVARLRKKLDGPVDGHRVIETVAAVGYRYHGDIDVTGTDQR